ncbi:30S ribosomal protein S9 [Candidatus Gottesmanbacteria bacterium]|nr:30S ribosomal protein S9 [Candidatus Gottesmanbacteria bacterium]
MPRKKKESVVKEAPKTEKVVKTKQPEFYQAIGRRKLSTVRVKLYTSTNEEITLDGKTVKKGEMIINKRAVGNYFPGAVNEKLYMEPFRTTNTAGRFMVSAIIAGGGLFGQLDAFIHGVSRALEKVDKEKFRPILKKKGFLTRDPRSKERRKAGFAQKARAKKQSPKR